MGRAVRATVEFSGVTREVFSAAAAEPALQRLVRGLPRAAPGADGHCRCGRCGVVLEGLQLVIADVDQAFEACQGHAFLPAWQQVAEEYRTLYNTNHVLVRRGPRYQAKIGGTHRSRGWWVLSLDQMAAGLQAAALGTFVFAGNLALQMHGMSIGGAMSSAAVAVKLGCEEALGFRDRGRFHTLGFPAGDIEK